MALAVGLLVIVLPVSGVLAAEDREAGLSLSDLAPYRAALEGKPAGPSAPAAVTFRDLWEHPDRYQRKRVQVEGRVARRFRQGAFGTFPPLVEAWAVSPAGDPFCLVFPAPPSDQVGNDAAPGSSVRFEGTFLRRLRYQGGDVPRLAPLIVGDRPPSVTAPAPPKDDHNALAPESPGGDLSRIDWAVGLVVAFFLALALAYRHLHAPLRRPPRRILDDEPPPEFLDDV